MFKLLFLDILTDDLELRRELETKVTDGPYSELFRKKLDLEKDKFTIVDATKETFPNPNNYRGIIIGGSLENPVVGEEKPWMRKVYSFIKETINQKVPLLGVCGGHQFIAKALGKRVIYNPKGREFGTIELTLTKEGMNDLLFKNMPQKFLVQVSHRCIVEKISPDWKLLASSNLCEIQAVAINKRTRMIQFHPEFSTYHLKSIARLRKESLIKEGFIEEEKFKQFLSLIKNTSYSTKILRNFLKYCIT